MEVTELNSGCFWISVSKLQILYNHVKFTTKQVGLFITDIYNVYSQTLNVILQKM